VILAIVRPGTGSFGETGAMSGVLDAFQAFFDHLRAVAWEPVLLALLCQVTKMCARSRAWQNVLAAAYPSGTVRWRTVFGASAAGAGVNAIAPVRAGDLLKLYLVKRRVEGAHYATLAASLLVETLVDAVLSGALLLWAIYEGVLPGVRILDRMPSVDWFWLFRHPRAAAVTAGALLVLGFALVLLAAAKIREFRARVGQGLAVMRTPGRYVRGVVVWQLVDWCLRLTTIYFFLRAFHVPTTAANVLRVQVTQSLSTIVPLTPAGIGTEQVMLVYVLSGQASRSALLSLSVGMKTILSAFNLVLGMGALVLTLRTLHWRRLVEEDTVRVE
jgi:glycosyltransferase 2 family protein